MLSAGCTAAPETPAAVSNDATLPAVALPDLSRTEKGVQQQLSEQYRALTSKIENHSAPADLGEAYGQMGNLLLAAEYVDAAEACYLHAESLAPNDVRWPYYLGHVYTTKAELGKAVTSFDRALRLKPDDVASLVWLGGVHLDLGEPELAEPLYAKALSLQPGTVAAMFGLGRAALARRDFRAAVDRFEQTLSSDPRATIVHYPLALAYRGLGDTAKAEEHLRQRGSLEVGPPDPLMVQLRGLIHSGVSEENEGIRALDAGDFKNGRRAFSPGRRAGAGQPVAAPQAGHRPVADRRCARGGRAIRRGRAAVAGVLAGPLQPGPAAGGQRTVPGGSRPVLDGRAVRAELRGCAAAARRDAAADRAP